MWTWSRSAVVSFRPRLVSKWKSVLWSDESKFDIVVGNQVEGDLPACYHHSVRKPASQMVWGCISASAMGSLHVLEGRYECWKAYKGFRANKCSPQDDVYFSRTMQNHIPSAITTACLRSRRGRVLNWPACSPDISAIENIWWHHWTKNTVKDDHKLFSSWKPISGKNGTNTKTPETQTSSEIWIL